MYSHNSGQMLTHQPPHVWDYSLEGINMKDFMFIFCLILPQKSFKHPYLTVLSATVQESEGVKDHYKVIIFMIIFTLKICSLNIHMTVGD